LIAARKEFVNSLLEKLSHWVDLFLAQSGDSETLAQILETVREQGLRLTYPS